MPRATRAAAGAVVLLLVLDGLAAVQITRSRHPPSFDRGGRFRRALADRAPPPGGATTVPTAPSTVTTAPPNTASGPPPTTVAALPPTTAPPAVLGASVVRPAAGTYVYAVDGSESATGFGSRSLGPQLTVVVHHGPGAGADEMVFDYEFSWQHEEREILAYRQDGVFLTYEAGSLTFGPVTETSETSIEPAVGLVPAPLQPGSGARGTSTARAGDGSTIRVEDWTTGVLRREPVATPAGTVDAWVVAFRRNSRDGTSERLDQSITWWFDPARGLPVKWEESLHAERDKAVTLSYDAHVVAALSSGPAG